MVGEAAALQPAAPEVDCPVEAALAVLARVGWDRGRSPAERAEADLAGLHPVTGTGVGGVDAQGEVAGQDQLQLVVGELSVGPGITAPLPVDPGRSVVEGWLADHLDVDLALDAL